MNPESVAIYGASNNPNRIGGRSLSYMLQKPFAGQIYPINPNRDAVQGVRAFASAADVPAAPDVAIVAVAASQVSQTIDELAQRGTKNAIIFSSGFAEVGAEGQALQAAIVDQASAAGMRLLGPNSLGLLNTRNNFWGTFTSSLEAGFPRVGRIGIASQSGAYGAHMLSAAMMRDLGISAFVTTGNEGDVTTADAIDWMVEDEGTDVVIAYLEGIRNGDRLVSALDAARAARKPVIVMKAGRSALGGQAAQSHTASLAGNDAVADAVLKELGALRIETTQQALDFAETATKKIYPVGNSLGVLTVSGGAGILIADDCERLDLPMPELPKAAQDALTEMLPFSATRNPVDCTAQALNELRLVGDFGSVMMEHGHYKSLMIFFSQAGGAKSIVPGLREELRRIRDNAPDCLLVLCVLASPEVINLYREDGYLVFDDPARAVAAIAAMGRLGDGFEKGRKKAAPLGLSLPDFDHSPNEAEAKAVFASAGLTVSKETVVTTARDAASAAEEIGLPVVMKIVSADIPHKTEIGGVIVNIANAKEAEQGFETLVSRAKTARPDAKLDGILVSQQIVGGVECIMGVMRDPVFGPVAMFGLGGIFVEVLKDVVLRRCPFGPDDAQEMIRAIRSFAMLDGVRGAEPVDIDALADMLSRLSRLAVDIGPRLLSIDINPVIATSDGAYAVDAIIEIDPSNEYPKRKQD